MALVLLSNLEKIDNLVSVPKNFAILVTKLGKIGYTVFLPYVIKWLSIRKGCAYVMSFRGVLMVLGLFILGVAFSGFASYSNGVMHPKETVEIDGKKLAGQYCSSCHGKDFKGDKGPSLVDKGAKLSEETIAQVIRDGIAGGADSAGMPAFAGGKLKDEKQIQAVATYIKTLSEQK